jgi:serine/threonine-protein kinase
MPLADVIAIIGEVADALEYAHAAGIVHRDVKPENILMLRDHALVADFGIARAITQASTPSLLTSSGLILGTPAYMSPEQAVGDTEIDGRSDVYSLATTCFEMLTGTLPFAAPTLRGLVAKRFAEPAPRLRTLLPDIPQAVDDAVAAALSLDPANRPRTPLAFAMALSPAATEATTSISAIDLTTSQALRGLAAISNPALPSVAVLPFANLSADPENEFLSDGITE